MPMIKCETKKENRRCANTSGPEITEDKYFPSNDLGKFN